MSQYLTFDGMTWPNPDDPHEVEWALRYKTGELTASERAQAASFVAAYRQLVNDPVGRRNHKVAGIRRAREETS